MACRACYSTGLVQRPTYWPGMCTSSRSGAATDAKPLRFPECVHAKLGANRMTTSTCRYKPECPRSLGLIVFQEKLLTGARLLLHALPVVSETSVDDLVDVGC